MTQPLIRRREISEQAADRLARLIATGILLCDLLAGVAWLAGSPHRSSGPAYRQIRQLLDPLPADPARWWGGLLVLIAALALLALATGSEIWVRRYFAILLSYWAAWAVFYTWSAATVRDAAWTGAALALISCLGHVRPIVAPQRLTTRLR